MNKQLTPKQERFIQEYLVDSNATKAALRAGYKKKSAYSIGEENLTSISTKYCDRSRSDPFLPNRSSYQSDDDWLTDWIRRIDATDSIVTFGIRLMDDQKQGFVDALKHVRDNPVPSGWIDVKYLARYAK